MSYLQTISRANGGAFIVLTPDDCKMIDSSIDKAINSAYERGIAAAKAISQITKDSALKPMYSYAEVRDMFGICRGTILNWAKQGIIKTSGVGNKRYVTGDSIEKIYELTNQRAMSRV